MLGTLAAIAALAVTTPAQMAHVLKTAHGGPGPVLTVKCVKSQVHLGAVHCRIQFTKNVSPGVSCIETDFKFRGAPISKNVMYFVPIKVCRPTAGLTG